MSKQRRESERSKTRIGQVETAALATPWSDAPVLNGAAASQAEPAPPEPNLPVIRHAVGEAHAAHPLFFFDVQDVEPDTIYVAEAAIWLPRDFKGTRLGLVMVGFAAEASVLADLERVERWQTISVTAHVPPGMSRTIPALLVAAPPGAVVYSTGWVVRRKVPSAASRPRPAQHHYRFAWARDLAKDGALHGAVTREPCLPDVEIPIPPIAFGQIRRPAGPVVEWPPDNWELKSYKISGADMFTFRDAIVHGEQGIITVGDFVIGESLHFAQPNFVGFDKIGDDVLQVAQAEPELELERAAHAMCGYVGNRNYAHWWMDVVPALLVPPFHEAFADAQLLMPKLRMGWQRQTLELLPEARGCAVFVGEQTRVKVRELRYVPQISQSDLAPHPFRAKLLAAVKERAGWRGEGGKRIYVARRDARARRLLNEEEAVTLLERHGFEAVTLTGMDVKAQIRLFAAASHVVGAHGAGLGNILFCEPGATLCEFQMTSNVQWSIRRIAAVSRMNYGCIMGTAADDNADVNLRDWTIDLGELSVVLADAFA